MACRVWSSPHKGDQAKESSGVEGGRRGFSGPGSPSFPSSTPGFRFQKGLARSPPLCRGARSMPVSSSWDCPRPRPTWGVWKHDHSSLSGLPTQAEPLILLPGFFPCSSFEFWYLWDFVLVTQLCPTLCDPRGL